MAPPDDHPATATEKEHSLGHASDSAAYQAPTAERAGCHAADAAADQEPTPEPAAEDQASTPERDGRNAASDQRYVLLVEQAPAAERTRGRRRFSETPPPHATHRSASAVDQEPTPERAAEDQASTSERDVCHAASDQRAGLLVEQAPAVERTRGRRRFSETPPAHATRRAASAVGQALGGELSRFRCSEVVPCSGIAPRTTIGEVLTATGEQEDDQGQRCRGHIRSRVRAAREGPPGRRRNRWEQAPSRCLNCPTGLPQRIMTCCQVLLCTDCAVVNPCGCREWVAGRGFPVPVPPRYEIPADCELERPVMLAYPRWQLFRATRAGDEVRYCFYCVEDVYHRQEVMYQFHRYETTGRTWSRIHCLLVGVPGGIHAYFAYPPISEADEQVIQSLRARAERILSVT